MLLQRFISTRTFVVGLLASLVLAGCGGPGPVRDTAEPQQPVGGQPAPGETPVDMPEAPAQVQTMFEQATAVMAAGDFLDAELRFKEFVLNYPEYPGAWVNLAIIHGNNENDEAAREALDRALALNPNHPAALNQLGLLLRRNGNFLEAEAAYLKLSLIHI